MNSEKIYLACPYAHEDKSVSDYRVSVANKYAAKLMDEGYRVFSPLSHSTAIAPHCKANQDQHAYWMKQDLWLLKACDQMIILAMPGWTKSAGIRDETKLAIDLEMPIIIERNWEV